MGVRYGQSNVLFAVCAQNTATKFGMITHHGMVTFWVDHIPIQGVGPGHAELTASIIYYTVGTSTVTSLILICTTIAHLS